jgi:hypothetical protein
MGLMAARAANRRQTRQTYRTMARMERRRSFVQSRMGMRQDFGRQEQPVAAAAPAAARPSPNTWVSSNGSPSFEIRASSATRTSRPRRSTSWESEKTRVE